MKSFLFGNVNAGGQSNFLRLFTNHDHLRISIVISVPLKEIYDAPKA